MNDIETKLIDQLAFGEITEDEFLKNFPINLSDNKDYLITLMNNAIEEKDGESLSSILDSMAILDLYKDFDHQSIYRKLIKENWHQMHEELVDSLDKKDVNEDYFIHVLEQVYEYHKDAIEDFMVPIWSKCLWNLYEIKSDKAIDIIKQYSNSKYEYIRKTVETLLAKLNG